MRTRLLGAGAASIAALAALGFAMAAATLALAQALGPLVAVTVMALACAALAAVGWAVAMHHARHHETVEGRGEPLAASLARDLVRKQPLSAMLLLGALGYVAGDDRLRPPTSGAACCG